MSNCFLPPQDLAVISINESTPIIGLLNNLVDPSNANGVTQLMMQSPGTTFAQDVLNSAEGYVLYLSAALEQDLDVEGELMTAEIILEEQNICKQEWGIEAGEEGGIEGRRGILR